MLLKNKATNKFKVTRNSKSNTKQYKHCQELCHRNLQRCWPGLPDPMQHSDPSSNCPAHFFDLSLFEMCFE